MRVLNGRFGLAVSVVAVVCGMGGRSTAYGQYYTGMEVQNVTNTQSSTSEVSYRGAPAINGDGFLAFTTVMSDGIALLRCAVNEGGGNYQFVIVDIAGPGQDISSFGGSPSLSDGNHVAYMGYIDPADRGVWRGSVVVSSGSPPIATVQTIDTSLASSRESHCWSSAAANGNVGYIAYDTASIPVLPRAYRAFDTQTGITVQNVGTGSVGVSSVVYQQTNNYGDTVVEGAGDLPGGGTGQVLAVVNPDDSTHNAVIARSGDPLGGGMTADGFTGSAVISSDRTVVAIVNATDTTGSKQALMQFNAMSNGSGGTLYTPAILWTTCDWITGFNQVSIVNTGQTNVKAVLATHADGGTGIYATPGNSFIGSAVVQTGDTPIVGLAQIDSVDMSREALEYHGTSMNGGSLASASGDVNGGWPILAFAAVLEDGTGVIAVGTLVPEPTTLALLALSTPALLRRRKRHDKSISA